MSDMDFTAQPKKPFLCVCFSSADEEKAREKIEELYFGGWNVCTDLNSVSECESVLLLLFSDECDDKLAQFLSSTDKDIICCTAENLPLPEKLTAVLDRACEITYPELDCFLTDTDMVNFGRRKQA